MFTNLDDRDLQYLTAQTPRPLKDSDRGYSTTSVPARDKSGSFRPRSRRTRGRLVRRGRDPRLRGRRALGASRGLGLLEVSINCGDLVINVEKGVS